MKLSLWDVFNFFGSYDEFTASDRFLELICVCILALILTAATIFLIYKKIKQVKK